MKGGCHHQGSCVNTVRMRMIVTQKEDMGGRAPAGRASMSDSRQACKQLIIANVFFFICLFFPLTISVISPIALCIAYVVRFEVEHYNSSLPMSSASSPFLSFIHESNNSIFLRSI